MNLYTSRFLFDNYTLFVSECEYLDSKHVHRTLTELVEELGRVAGFMKMKERSLLGCYMFMCY